MKCDSKDVFMVVNYEKNNHAIGITKKIFGQIEAMKKLGYHVFYTAYVEGGIEISDANTGEIICFNKYFTSNKKVQHAIRRFLLLIIAKKYIVERKETLKAVYIRYLYFDGPMLGLLKSIKRKHVPIVMEMHSYPCLGLHFSWEGVFFILDKTFQNRCAQFIDCFANMSQNDLPFVGKQKVVTISNTLDPNAIKMRKPVEKKDDTLRLLSVAYEREAHGFDRVVKGLSEYYRAGGTKRILVYFVGKYLKSTHELVRKLDLGEYCQFIDPVEGKELDYYYDLADIAIGHLANHRIGSYSGSSIKIQEYMAKGIPFIYAWNEMTIPSKYKYAFKFDLNDEPIDFNLVVSFFDSLPNPQKVARDMRSDFERFAGWDNQLKKVMTAL